MFSGFSRLFSWLSLFSNKWHYHSHTIHNSTTGNLGRPRVLGLAFLISVLGIAAITYSKAEAADRATAGTPYTGSVRMAQTTSRYFTETGKTVQGRFLQYWQQHGELAQQGFPISNAFTEVSPVDGKTYQVQYFERAVFEYHPENRAPNDVLLSLLGAFRYKAKYPNGAKAAEGNWEEPDGSPSPSKYFPETKQSTGGLFLDYWNRNGGLAQQGYPISPVLSEVSELDGKAYLVQYFERAVFEYHPEKADTPYSVLLSQLGTFRFKQTYPNGEPKSAPSQATPTPRVIATPIQPNPGSSCPKRTSPDPAPVRGTLDGPPAAGTYYIYTYASAYASTVTYSGDYMELRSDGTYTYNGAAQGTWSYDSAYRRVLFAGGQMASCRYFFDYRGWTMGLSGTSTKTTRIDTIQVHDLDDASSRPLVLTTSVP